MGGVILQTTDHPMVEVLLNLGKPSSAPFVLGYHVDTFHPYQ
jgi:hypothetical protein